MVRRLLEGLAAGLNITEIARIGGLAVLLNCATQKCGGVCGHLLAPRKFVSRRSLSKLNLRRNPVRQVVSGTPGPKWGGAAPWMGRGMLRPQIEAWIAWNRSATRTRR